MDPNLCSPLQKLQQSLKVVNSRQPNLPINNILLCRLIHFSNRTLEQAATDVLAPEGLLLSHWMVLAMLYGSPDFRRRPQELSRAIGQSGPNTTKTTLFLIEKGWIQRLPDADNRRSCWMELLPEGRTWIESFFPIMWHAYQQNLAPLSSDEQHQLIVLLEKLLTGHYTSCPNS